MSDVPSSTASRLTGDLPTPYPGHVREFQQLYQKRFGVRRSSEQALQQLISLLVIVNYRQHNDRYEEEQRQ